MNIRTHVDADHAGSLETQMFHTGILIYFNNSLGIWFSNQYNTGESSIFGYKFLTLIIATEVLVSLKYKLRMFGILIDGTADVFKENQYVTKNTTSTHSFMNKRNNSIRFTESARHQLQI